jgi:hypothetical protein
VRLIVFLKIKLRFNVTAELSDVVVEMQVDHAYVGDDTVDPEKRLLVWL